MNAEAEVNSGPYEASGLEVGREEVAVPPTTAAEARSHHMEILPRQLASTERSLGWCIARLRHMPRGMPRTRRH
eukprot:2545659-Prymnesium_polylepis.3